MVGVGVGAIVGLGSGVVGSGVGFRERFQVILPVRLSTTFSTK
jgi:hypothetical protein